MSNELIETQSTEVAEVSHRDTGPGALMAEAIASGNPEMVTAIADVYSKLESERLDRKAVTDFNAALTAACLEMPAIKFDGYNKQTQSKYAKFPTMMNAVSPVLNSHGLTVSFTTTEANNEVTTICTIRHIGGGSDTSTVTLPKDGVGAKGGRMAMNALQGIKSSNEYGKRITLGNALSLVIGDDYDADDDGNAAAGGSNNRPLTETELIEFEELIEASKSDRPILEKTLNTRFGVKSIEHLTTGKAYDFALSAMRSKINA